MRMPDSLCRAGGQATEANARELAQKGLWKKLVTPQGEAAYEAFCAAFPRTASQGVSVACQTPWASSS
jgi:hypothetical protein